MDSLKWTFDNGSTFLHLAVVYNNLEIITYLLINGYDIDTLNNFGETSLLTALKVDNFDAVALLVTAGANICAVDPNIGKTALELLMTKKREAVDAVIVLFTNSLIRMNLDNEVLIELLIKAGRAFRYVQLLKNQQGDFDTIELILRYGNSYSQWPFQLNLFFLTLSKRTDVWEEHLKRFCQWEIFTELTIENIDFMYNMSSTENLRILLDSGLHVLVKHRLEIDLRACICSNKNVDAVEFLQYANDFDANAIGTKHYTALHFAMFHHKSANAHFLIELGANVNATNNQGRTALFHCVYENYRNRLLMLLEAGADVQLTDNNGISVFQFAHDNKTLLMSMIIAQLAIEHDQGKPISPSIQDHINNNIDYRVTFQTCLDQLQVLKTYHLSERVTLYTILTNKVSVFYRWVNYEMTLSLRRQYVRRDDFNLFYAQVIKRKIVKTMLRKIFIRGITDIIFKTIGKLIADDHIIIRNILEYTSDSDIRRFSPTYSMNVSSTLL
ncbi:putative ankyrin repeat protein RF_0381 [Phymastichus coffea]|uniref:putative ankyrin repeat protein RF_0381 n=1 Tax=Phymastichus coffea TaxID=108790 RepID=UPI00273C5571|nr:putative ankyrin repeat protein RF_0381 [Phymastichus coffea]